MRAGRKAPDGSRGIDDSFKQSGIHQCLPIMPGQFRLQGQNLADSFENRCIRLFSSFFLLKIW